jgi:replication factor C small subunit
MSEEEKDLNFPWVEEFRPTKPEDVIGAEHLTSKMNEYLKDKSFPNLLFSGDAGTGKTTIAKILAYTVSGKENTLYINASDRNNIDTIRTDVVNFCATLGFEKTIKTIILDECDGLLPQSQKALRSVMEEYTSSTRFIMTCNYINKIIDPIKSRCTKYEFFGAKKEDIAKRCFILLKKKGVKIGADNKDKVITDIKTLVEMCYPDIRLTINNLQKFTKGDVFTLDTSIAKDEVKKKLMTYLKEKKIRQIREEILSTTPDYPVLYDTIFENSKELTIDVDKLGAIYICLADYMYKHQTHLNQELNFVACLIEIMNVLK